MMQDKDLPALYQVPTHRLNEAVKRNINRFPADFMFQLTATEQQRLISQIAISKNAIRGSPGFTFDILLMRHGPDRFPNQFV